MFSMLSLGKNERVMKILS